MYRGAKESTLEDLTPFTFHTLEDPVTGTKGEIGKYGEKIDGWLCFPLRSPSNSSVLGFEARDTDSKSVVKVHLERAQWNPLWITQTDTLDRIYLGEPLWVVEGVFDLFALQWAIRSPIVSSSRANLTSRQLDYISRYARGGVKIVYDNDTAGQSGLYGGTNSKGVVARIKQRGIGVEVIRYAGGKDPGDIWMNGGAAAIQKSFAKWC
jgi:hypothetical protein